jgi:hypothetical protein
MDMEDKKPFCPVLDVDGVIAGGKQFDLDITLPEDNRDVIYGVIKNCFKEPVCDAVVKLTEIVYNCGKEERRPIGHTFTDKEGEYIQDYKETQKYDSYIQDKIKNIYVFVNKKDNTIISSIGKVKDEVQNIDTKIVMDSQRKEYISNSEKIDITQGKTNEEIDEIYNAMEIKQQEKEKNKETQIKYIDNSR